MKSAYQLSLDVCKAFGTAHPQAFNVPHCGCGVHLGSPQSFDMLVIDCVLYWLGRTSLCPLPHISIRVEKPTKRPEGVPKKFKYENKTYRIIYELVESARLC